MTSYISEKFWFSGFVGFFGFFFEVNLAEK